MKYEVRMHALFTWITSKDNTTWKSQSTFIEYVDANDVGEAYSKAKQIKDEFAKKAFDTYDDLYKAEMSLDAVVAKPELDIVSFYPTVEKKLSKLKDKRKKVLHRIMYYLEDARKRIENYLAECDVHEAPTDDSMPEPPTPQPKRVCLKCGNEFMPSHRKQRHCVECL